MSSIKNTMALGLMAVAQLVAGHGAIIAATGDAGGTGMAIGVDTSTPRDGTRRNPFQQDSTRFRGDAADTVGETLGGGTNSVETGTKAIMAETGDSLPQVTQGGEVEMTLHQVNADGGGPYTCEINDDGTAATWQSIKVTTTPPGENSRNRDGAQTDFPLVAAIPASQECTGTVAGQDNVCLVRCMNAARAGPFGGVVPVQMSGGAAAAPAAGNATAAADKATDKAAAARRALAQSIKRSDALLAKMIKRAKSVKAADELSEEELIEIEEAEDAFLTI